MKHVQVNGEKRLRIRNWGVHSFGECTVCLLGGGILAGADLMGQALPLAACFVAALPLGIRSLTAVLGALLGYFLRCEAAEAVEFSALSLLMLSSLALFQGTGLPLKAWFMPLLSAVICAILGSVRLIGTLEVTWSLWLSKVLLAGLCTDAFSKALRGSSRARVLLMAALAMGLLGEGGFVDLGLLFATAVSAAGRELLTPLALGIGIDIGGIMQPCATAAMALPAVFCRVLHTHRAETRAFSYAVIPMAVLLFFDALTAQRIISLCLGAVSGYLLHRLGLLRTEGTVAEEESGMARLEEAAQIMEILGGEVSAESQTIMEAESEEVFDAAAEQVCRGCAFFHRCWQNRAAQTYQELSAASIRIMERGIAYEEDFSREFRDRCCHTEALIGAINRELEGMLFRRRYRMQLRESRKVLSEEYSCVASYLRAAGTARDTEQERHFMPRVSVCSANKNGARVSGDRGACFMGTGSSYYVLLCDGMGTGEEAAKLSNQAVRLLERLLKSGLEPEAALRLFNGNMLLRGTGAFSTVDLLQLDLHTGMAMLYKWGAAPSYWRGGDQVKKIGTASPPPGVGVGEDHLPERYKLSLKGGEVLVLISDGAYGEETEANISAYRNASPQELAALLIAGMQAEDDMTAIVVSLRLRAS